MSHLYHLPIAIQQVSIPHVHERKLGRIVLDLKGNGRHIGAACQACHAAYREQDPSTQAYRVRRLAQ